MQARQMHRYFLFCVLSVPKQVILGWLQWVQWGLFQSKAAYAKKQSGLILVSVTTLTSGHISMLNTVCETSYLCACSWVCSIAWHIERSTGYKQRALGPNVPKCWFCFPEFVSEAPKAVWCPFSFLLGVCHRNPQRSSQRFASSLSMKKRCAAMRERGAETVSRRAAIDPNAYVYSVPHTSLPLHVASSPPSRAHSVFLLYAASSHRDS